MQPVCGPLPRGVRPLRERIPNTLQKGHIMKEKWKYFLLGAGSVVGGFLLYVLTRDTAKPTRITCDDRAASTPAPGASSSAARAYIARRRAQIQKQRAARSGGPLRPEPAEASMANAGTSAPATQDHAVQNTGAEKNNK